MLIQVFFLKYEYGFWLNIVIILEQNNKLHAACLLSLLRGLGALCFHGHEQTDTWLILTEIKEEHTTDII